MFKSRLRKFLGVAAGLLILAIGTVLALVSHDAECRAAPPRVAGAPLMRAVVYRCYGAATVAHVEELEKPRPAAGRVLVKVSAASVNPLDWHYLKGEPNLMRLMVGIGRPKDVRLGTDFAGVVEAVGPGVTRFKPGDTVFGGINGAFAEYATAREHGSLALVPAGVSLEQAAAVPVAGLTALQALRDVGKVKPGQRVLINGASGGVGPFAVQIARILGAHVTGVCSARNADMVRSLGAERVIDYTHEDFTRLADRYDLIIDNVGSHSMSQYRRALTPQGAVVQVGGVTCGLCLGTLVGWAYEGTVSSLSAQKSLSILADLNARDLETVAAWMARGRLRAVIDRSYPLTETPAALAYVETGHARAKVLIRVTP